MSDLVDSIRFMLETASSSPENKAKSILKAVAATLADSGYNHHESANLLYKAANFDDMILTSCPAPADEPDKSDNDDLAKFAGDLAEVVEFKLLGINGVNGIEWDDYASDILARYHQFAYSKTIDYKPLWRTMHETYCRLPKASAPNIVFSQLINTITKRIDCDFPIQEISKKVLIDYLKQEQEKANDCI